MAKKILNFLTLAGLALVMSLGVFYALVNPQLSQKDHTLNVIASKVSYNDDEVNKIKETIQNEVVRTNETAVLQAPITFSSSQTFGGVTQEELQKLKDSLGKYALLQSSPTAPQEGSIDITGTLYAGSIAGNGSLLTNVNAISAAFANYAQNSDKLDGYHFSSFAWSIHGHTESDVANLTADLSSKLNLSGGTMVGNITWNSTQTFGNATIANLSELVGGAPTLLHSHASVGLWLDAGTYVYPTNVPNPTDFQILDTGGLTLTGALSAGSASFSSANISGSVIAASFSGSGASLTNVNAAQLGSQLPSYYTDAANLSTGTLSTNRYSAYSDLSAEGRLGTGGGMDVDMVDSYHAGNASGNVPISNSTLNTNLNADLLDGSHAAAFQPIDSTLTALAGYNTNGLLTQTAPDTFTGRTITGTLNRLSISNGDGVLGNPTIDIDANYTGQATISTLGTITTGTWNAGTVTSSGNINTTVGAIQTNSIARIDNSGNLTFIGTTQLNSQTYTWPGAQTASGFLQTNGTGTLSWTTTVPATSVPFSGITGATNTSAAMVVGTGSSLNYTGSGTINASSLIGSTWAIPGAIGAGTPSTGAFTTLSANNGLTVSVGGASITGGINNNVGGITNMGAISGATTITASGNMAIDTDTLFVDAAGEYVGIGTPTPSTLLDVYTSTLTWTTLAQFGATDKVIIGLDDGSYGWIGTGTARDLRIGTNQLTAMTVQAATGNIGIGDTTPDYLLDVGGTGRFTGLLLTQNGLTVSGASLAVGALTINPADGSLTTTGALSGGAISGTTGNYSGQITSTVATGSSPFVITSTTLVSNLNADMVDSQHGPFAPGGSGNYIQNQSAAAQSASFWISGTGRLDNTLTVSAGGLAVSAGGASITGGINANSGGLTNTGTIAGATTISGTGAITVQPAAGSNLNISLSGTGDLAVNTNQLYVDTDTGRVGIGTTSPGANLHVYNLTSNATALIESGAAGGDSALTIKRQNDAQRAYLAYQAGATTNWYVGNLYSGASNTKYSIATGANLSDSKLVVQTDGNVGIGTTGPGYKLDVNGTFGNNNNFSMGSGGMWSGSASILTSNANTFTVNSGTLTLGNDATDVVGISGNTMYFPGTGNVGIGTTSPGARLHIAGGNLRLNSVNDGTARLELVGNSATGHGEIHTTNTIYSLLLQKDGGNVGIGTTSPVGKLDIVGSQNFSAFSAPGALTAGTPTAGGSCTPGTHSYKVTFTSVGGGETTGGTTSNQITCVLTTGQTVPLSAIPLGPTGTTGRKIYRTNAGDVGTYYLVITINDNTTTTASDTTADNTTTAAPASNTTAVANIQTGGTSKMVIDANGNVGIGTTGPNWKTQIAADNVYNGGNNGSGQLAITGSTDTNKRLLLGYDTTNNYAWIGSVLYGSGWTPLVLQPYGNVGIGTTSPTNILSLGSAADRKFWIEDTASGTVGRALTVAAGGTVAGTADITGGNLILQSGLGTGTGASTISFQTGTTLGTGTTLQTMSTKMTILGNGNVGIGTTAPSSALHVYGTGTPSGNARITVEASLANAYTQISHNSVGNATVQYNFGNTYTTAGRYVQASHLIDATGAGGLGLSATAGSIRVYTGGDNERMRISSTGGLSFGSTYVSSNPGANNAIFEGNVGIGTTSPQWPLDIYKSDSNSMRLDSLTGNETYILSRGAVSKALFGIAGAANQIITGSALDDLAIRGQRILFSGDSGATAHMVIQNNGNVGIGTTSPGALLHTYKSQVGDTTSKIENPNTGSSARASLQLASDAAFGGLYVSSAAYDAVSGWADSFIIRSDSTTTGGTKLSAETGGISLQTNTNDTRLYVQDDGNVGIGTTSPGAKLDIAAGTVTTATPALNITQTWNEGTTAFTGLKQNITNTASSYLNAKLFDFQVGGTSRINTTVEGQTVIRSVRTANQTDNMYGLDVQVNPQHSNGTITETVGGKFTGLAASANSYTGIYGVQGFATNSNGVAVANLYGLYGKTALTSSANTTNAYGVYIDSAADSGAGAIGNNYGLYIANQTVGSTLNYGLYSVGGTNYFGGNVGIGTTSPTANLTVAQGTTGPGTVATNGTVTLTGTGTTFTNTFKVGDTITVSGETVRTIATITNDTSLTATAAFSTIASGLTYTLTGGTRLVVQGNGNVGIGTTSPSRRLVVNDPTTTTSNTIASYLNPSLIDGQRVALMIGTLESTNQVGYMGFIQSSPLNQSLLTFGQWGANDLMVIRGDGNVGIGTTSPGAKLDVLANAGATGIFTKAGTAVSYPLVTSADSAGRSALFGDSSITASSFASRGVQVNVTSTYGEISSYSNVNTAATAPLVLNSLGGNVGIGTTAPTGTGLGANFKTLELSGVSANVFLRGSTDVFLTLSHSGAAADGKNWDFYATGTKLDFRLVNDAYGIATNWLEIERSGTTVTDVSIPTGNVGIGTTSPSSKLFVANGEAFVDYSTGGATSGGALRLATNGAQSFMGSNQYYGGAPANVRYARNGGAGFLNFDTSAGATAGDIGFYTAPSGTADAVATFSPVMTLKQGGNVGIGTTSPGKKLTVAGSGSVVQFKDSSDVASEGGFVFKPTAYDSGTPSKITSYQSSGPSQGLDMESYLSATGYMTSGFQFRNDGTIRYLTGTGVDSGNTAVERMRINVTGNVGIGTISPVGKLDIVGSQNFSAFSAPGALTAGTPTAGGSCTPGTHSYKTTFISVGGGETTGGTTSNQITCVLTTGQTVPLSAIPLGPAGTTGRKIYRTNAGDVGTYYLVITINDNTTTTSSDTTADNTTTAAPASNTTAVADLQTGGTSRMVINSSGNVGIGTTSPATALTVGNQGATKEIRMDVGSLGTQAILGYAVYGIDYGQLYLDRDTFNFILTQKNNAGYMGFGTNSRTTDMVISNAGNVGIGTATPGAQLDLSTDSARKLTTTTWSTGSDARIKNNVESISNALDVIKSVRPVKYNYTTDFLAAHPSVKDTDYYNFIAQEYQQVFPDSVTMGSDGLLYLNSSNMIPYAIAGIKEQQGQIEGLNASVVGLNTGLGTLQLASVAGSEALDAMKLDIEELKTKEDADAAKIAELEGRIALLEAQPENSASATGTLTADQENILAMFSLSADGKTLTVKGDLEVQGRILGSTSSRGKNIDVPQGRASYTVTFAKPRASADYAVSITPSWMTQYAVTEKRGTGFIIEFSVPAPTSATVDWLVID